MIGAGEGQAATDSTPGLWRRLQFPLVSLAILAVLAVFLFWFTEQDRKDLAQWLTNSPALLLLLAAVPIVLLASWKHIYPNVWLIPLALLPVIPSTSIAFRPFGNIALIASFIFLAMAVVARVAHAARNSKRSKENRTKPSGFASTRTILCLLACLVVAALSRRDELLPVIVGLDIAVLCLMVFDLVTIPRVGHFQVERSCQKTASLGKKHPVSLMVSNLKSRSSLTQRVADVLDIFLPAPTILVRDDVSQEFEAHPEDFEITVRGRTRRTLTYDLTPQRRGAFEFEKIHLLGRSRLGLWKRIMSYPAASSINVYPDMKQLAQFELLARTNRLSLMGVRRTRRIGTDNDFERLRDYTLDDNYKHIDWRSTARRQKLTVRDFQTSQSQRVIFMIDCGRMMTNQAAGLSLLDHSLNAMLMLSYIALQRGDSVGLLCFSDRIHSFVPPRGGSRQMNHLLRASFDRFPELVESRYGEAFLHLSKHCRKRSLVILMTNLIDEINANQVHQYLSTIVGRHLPLGVLMRDHELFRAADTNWRTDAGLYRAAAAAEIVCWRHEVIKELQHQGVLSLDVYPEEMTAPLINQYLEVKARHLL